MKRLLSTLFLALAAPLPASAHLLDVTAGLSLWSHQPTGDISYVGNNNDLKNDLGLGSSTQLGAWVSLEHPIPVLPNIKVAYNEVSSSGDGTLKFNFGNVAAGVPVHSNVTLNQLDTILYYQPLDRIVTVDAGLDIKLIDGNAKVISSGFTENKSFMAPLPMLYANLAFKLPFTGLTVGANGSFVAYAGNHLSDVTARVAYESPIGIGVMAGYRTEQLKVKNIDQVNINATIDGPFGAVFYHF